MSKSGPEWWMEMCLAADYDSRILNKLGLISLYTLCGKIINDSVLAEVVAAGRTRIDALATWSPAQKSALRARVGDPLTFA